MKKFLIHTFFTPKFLGPFASLVTGLAAAWVVSVLPGAPEFVTVALDLVMDVAAGRVPEVTPGHVITSAELVAFLGPLVALVFNGLIQHSVAKDANKTLEYLKEQGQYDGPIDGWVGDVAFTGLQELTRAMQDGKH